MNVGSVELTLLKAKQNEIITVLEIRLVLFSPNRKKIHETLQNDYEKHFTYYSANFN